MNSITSKANPTGCRAADAVDILWVVLADRTTTNGAFSLVVVECELTDYSLSLENVVRSLSDWGTAHRQKVREKACS